LSKSIASALKKYEERKAKKRRKKKPHFAKQKCGRFRRYF